MKNQDTILEDFKNAANNAEPFDFAGFEKVWSRVDAKLDTQIIKQKKVVKQKWFIAATLIPAVLLLSFLLKNNLKPENNIQNQVVEKTNPTGIAPKLENKEEIVFENKNSITKEEAKIKLKETLKKNNETQIAILEPRKEKNQNLKPNVNVGILEMEEKIAAKENVDENLNSTNPAYNNSRVGNSFPESKKSKSVTVQNIPKAEELVILDGEAITADKKEKLNNEDTEVIIHLKEPLYIINGVEYTEKELFGPNPTSPYYPLEKQNIVKNKVILPEDAVKKYGSKGKNGVVIINTKKGKPVN